MSEMPITRRKVLRTIGDALRAIGYRDVPGPLPCGALLYRREGDLVVTFGVEHSPILPETYTGAFYLSRTFTWSVMHPGFPRAAFERIGPLLPTEERASLLAPEYARPGIVEAFWQGFRLSSATHLGRAAQLAEPRFLARAGLADAVRACASLAEHEALVKAIAADARGLAEAPEGLVSQPRKPPFDVPPRYLWAAERVASALRPVSPRAPDVAALAIDAFRVATLR